MWLQPPFFSVGELQNGQHLVVRLTNSFDADMSWRVRLDCVLAYCSHVIPACAFEWKKQYSVPQLPQTTLGD
jgi:hypothetical protein